MLKYKQGADMIFGNKKLNRILNELLNNNKDAKRYFTKFIKCLPAPVLEILYDCENAELTGDGWEISTFFSPDNIQIEIYLNNQSMRVDMCPISHEQIAEIPVDNENDIFLGDDANLDSPAFFNIIYNPDVEQFMDYEAQDFGYYIVKKQNKKGEIGYYLISQSLDDCGIHSSKVDIEDFVIDPAECNFAPTRKLIQNNANLQSTKPCYDRNSRRAKQPRNPFLDY